jgi:hypothetical protein
VTIQIILLILKFNHKKKVRSKVFYNLSCEGEKKTAHWLAKFLTKCRDIYLLNLWEKIRKLQ